MPSDGTVSNGTVSRGKRRIDRVLAAGYLDGLRTATLQEVRGLRAEAEQEEVDLSYLRRLLQGRVDVVRAELTRRARPPSGTATAGSLVEGLSRTLAEQGRGPAHGLGRYSTVQPTWVDDRRRRLEALIDDTDLSDVPSHTDEDLGAALDMLSAEERTLSATRRQVQTVMDACGAELTRRYRDGEADVDALLVAHATDEG